MTLQNNIIEQLDILRFSYGILTDKGGQVILDNESKIKNLKLLDLKYNYFSDEMIRKLNQLPIKIDFSEKQDVGQKYKYPLITE